MKKTVRPRRAASKASDTTEPPSPDETLVAALRLVPAAELVPRPLRSSAFSGLPAQLRAALDPADVFNADVLSSLAMAYFHLALRDDRWLPVATVLEAAMLARGPEIKRLERAARAALRSRDQRAGEGGQPSLCLTAATRRQRGKDNGAKARLDELRAILTECHWIPDDRGDAEAWRGWAGSWAHAIVVRLALDMTSPMRIDAIASAASSGRDPLPAIQAATLPLAEALFAMRWTLRKDPADRAEQIVRTALRTTWPTMDAHVATSSWRKSGQAGRGK